MILYQLSDIYSEFCLEHPRKAIDLESVVYQDDQEVWRHIVLSLYYMDLPDFQERSFNHAKTAADLAGLKYAEPWCIQGYWCEQSGEQQLALRAYELALSCNLSVPGLIRLSEYYRDIPWLRTAIVQNRVGSHIKALHALRHVSESAAMIESIRAVIHSSYIKYRDDTKKEADNKSNHHVAIYLPDKDRIADLLSLYDHHRNSIFRIYTESDDEIKRIMFNGNEIVIRPLDAIAHDHLDTICDVLYSVDCPDCFQVVRSVRNVLISYMDIFSSYHDISDMYPEIDGYMYLSSKLKEAKCEYTTINRR